MKKGLVFFFGMIVGALLTFLTFGALYFIGNSNTTGDTGSSALYGDPGISLFDEPGDVMTLKGFRFFQVLPNGTALAQSTDKANVRYPNIEYGDPVVFFLPVEGSTYYDDLILNVPSGKVVRQIGTYRYKTKNEFVKTVPIVQIFDK